MVRHLLCCLLVLASFATVSAGEPNGKYLRAGIIGCDTSHVVAFTKMLNNPKAPPHLAGIKVVAAFPGGSTDIHYNYGGKQINGEQRANMYANTLKTTYKVELVKSIEQLLEKVDVVLLESHDGRKHLKQLIPVLKAGKPVFIDKPVAGSLADTLEIFKLAQKYKVPLFSSSSLRFCPNMAGMRNDDKVGKVMGCAAFSPCSKEAHHPDLYWYGIHGVEVLFTIMGPGCETVTRVEAPNYELVVGKWKDGRIGTFRGLRGGKAGYGALVYGSKGIRQSGPYTGYEGLVTEIVKFFKTGRPPVSAEETIQIYAFMEAADESKRNGGQPVSIASVIAKAEKKLIRK